MQIPKSDFKLSLISPSIKQVCIGVVGFGHFIILHQPTCFIFHQLRTLVSKINKKFVLIFKMAITFYGGKYEYVVKKCFVQNLKGFSMIYTSRMFLIISIKYIPDFFHENILQVKMKNNNQNVQLIHSNRKKAFCE